ncbi:hypothetical protein NM688_g4438 [Phlebia brevispora]|uniref:Uncharacterized protein n=1 Tax=Phlebia brevispora TaxID=194682 RepID=A0ACC1T331_9APHY|nr:hypothetical protein NM688_g4438 [Phlebia brevispora]
MDLLWAGIIMCATHVTVQASGNCLHEHGRVSAVDDDGECLLTVQGLTAEELSKMSYQTMIATALRHLTDGGAVLTYGQGSDPEDVYSDPNIYPGLFPWLYPYGLGGFANKLITKKVSVEKHVHALLLYHDRRFQTERYFPFLVFNRIQIKRSTRGGYLLTNRKNFGSIAEKLTNVDVEALAALSQRGEREGYVNPTTDEERACFELITYIDNVASHVPGSLTQKKYQNHEVRSMIYEFGSPAVFATFAPAGHKNPICLYLCGVPIDLDDAKDWPGLFGKTSAYYGTVEEQGRLALHLHMLVWIENACSPQELRNKLIENKAEFQQRVVAWMESISQGEFSTGTLSEVRQRVREKVHMPDWDPTTDDDICQQCTGDPVTELPRPPADEASPAEIDTWFNAVSEITDEILLRCNVHDKDHRRGCKRGRRRQCKARMPRDTYQATVVNLTDGSLQLKKGEAWMNTFCVIMVYLLRCNTDVTCLLSGTAVRAVLAYVTDYITKSSLKTYHVFEAIRMVLSRDGHLIAESASREEAARRLMTKIVNVLTARSEIGGPLVCQLLLGFPDHYTNQTFKVFFWQSYVRLVRRAWNEVEPCENDADSEEKVVIGRDGGTIIPVQKMNDYIYRPVEFENVSLEDFLRTTDVKPLPRRNSEYQANRTNSRENKLLRFTNGHPQANTHGVVRLHTSRILVYVGGALPRVDHGDREEYCCTMMTLFFQAGWRTGLELKKRDDSWNTAFSRTTFSTRQVRVMKNMNLLYECLDDRHDYASQRRAAERAAGLSVLFDADEIADLEKLRRDRDVLESVMDSDALSALDALLDNEGRAALKRRVERQRRETEMRMLDAEGYRKYGLPTADVLQFPDTFVNSNESSSYWKELTTQARNTELAIRLNRKGDVSATERNGEYDWTEVNDVRVRTQAQLDAEYPPGDEMRQRILDPHALMCDVANCFSLNPEQLRAFRISITHIIGRHAEPLRLYVGGSGGTGKSRVFDAVKSFFDLRGESYRYLVIAPTGSAASLISGSTYHSVLGFTKGRAFPTAKALARARERLALVDLLIIDEISMMSCTGFYNISERISNAFDLPTQSFAGRHVIIAGDFAQLPPPGRGELPLYCSNVGLRSSAEHVHGQKAAMGRALWHYFVTVILLCQNMRQNSVKAEDRAFGVALQNMRYGACTAADIRLLKSRISNIGKDRPHIGDPRFRNVAIITGRNVARDAINEVSCERFARERGLTLTNFMSRDTWGSGKLADSLRQTLRDAEHTYEPTRNSNCISRAMQLRLWDLPPADTDNLAGRLRLCAGMPVLLKRNVATELGATNGSEAIVVGWNEDENTYGDKYLNTLFVRLVKPTHRIHLKGLPENVIPVVASTIRIDCRMPHGKSVPVVRRQVEVLPDFSMTDFNSQGHTRPWNPVDLSQCYTQQSIYTALSRGTSLEGTLILSDFDDRRIRRGLSKDLLREFRELEILNDCTQLRFANSLPFDPTNMSRGTVIRCYQHWKGLFYVPHGVPQPLNWSTAPPTELYAPPAAEEWHIIQRKKDDSQPHAVQSTSESFPIENPLKRRLSGSTDRSEHNKRARMRTDVAPAADREPIDEPHVSLVPVGLRWDATHWSCSYDVMFSILFNCIYLCHTDILTGPHNSSTILTALSNGVHHVLAGNLAFEQVRDAVRSLLYQAEPAHYPYGPVCADVDRLAETLFKTDNAYATRYALCTNCGSQLQCSQFGYDNPIFFPSCSRLVTETTSYITEDQLLHAKFRDIDLPSHCGHCGAHHGLLTCIDVIQPPLFLFFAFQSGDVCLSRLQLCGTMLLIANSGCYRWNVRGLIYLGGEHFTCRFVDDDKTVWYHDGMLSGKRPATSHDNISVNTGHMNIFDLSPIRHKSIPYTPSDRRRRRQRWTLTLPQHPQQWYHARIINSPSRKILLIARYCPVVSWLSHGDMTAVVAQRLLLRLYLSGLLTCRAPGPTPCVPTHRPWFDIIHNTSQTQTVRDALTTLIRGRCRHRLRQETRSASLRGASEAVVLGHASRPKIVVRA